MNWLAYGIALPVLLMMGFLGWLYSLSKSSVNIVDTLWGLFFLLGGVVYLVLPSSPTHQLRSLIVLICVAAWSIRLALHLWWRNHGLGEDRRYQRIRADNEPFWIKSLFIVFGLQALLAWLISAPLFAAIQSNVGLGALDAAGSALWGIGFAIESMADWQLAAFKSRPENMGRVMRYGLWAYSRHPNYFGECTLWWGYYLFGCAAGAWWTLPAPLVMTILLLRVSGVTMLEADISERRPEYAQYKRTTSTFIPWIPRRPIGMVK
jgi:steroid 5-alpha reductase family enzyme